VDIISSLVFGLIYGLAEFFPVSAPAHQEIFSILTGREVEPAWNMAVHIGCLAAIFLAFFRRILHIQQEMRIASGSRSKRHPDLVAIADGRTILSATVPMFLGLMFLTWVQRHVSGLLVLAILLVCNGVALYVPQFLPGGNKDSRSMSRLDGLLLGAVSALSIFPGISRINAVLCTGRLRGADTTYLADMAVLLGIPWLLGLLILDIVAVVTAPVALSLMVWVSLILCALTAFGAGYAAISLLRFLSVKIGFTGFALYSWGLGLACFILYLMI